MNENIDLTKILDGCPKGTEFYHAGYGRVWFVGINLYSHNPIQLSTKGEGVCCIADVSVTEKGTLNISHEGECLLFPSKDQRDWSKFKRFWDKPKVEKFDVNTLQAFDKVLVRVNNKSIWKPNFFGYKDDTYIMCVSDRLFSEPWEQCIPYNKETNHLVGTNNDCPEYYKWWEE